MSWREQLRQIIVREDEARLRMMRPLPKMFLIPDASGTMSKEEIERGIAELAKLKDD